MLALPLESLEQVLQWVGPVERGQAAMACQQLRKAAEATVLEDVTIKLHADNVSTLAHWLQVTLHVWEFNQSGENRVFYLYASVSLLSHDR